MSELQVGLLGVGAVIVAAVFLYNKWQERRYRRQAEVGFASRHEDVLMRSGGGAGQGTLPTPSESDRIEPVLVAFEGEGEDAAASGPTLRPSAKVGAAATARNSASPDRCAGRTCCWPAAWSRPACRS